MALKCVIWKNWEIARNKDVELPIVAIGDPSPGVIHFEAISVPDGFDKGDLLYDDYPKYYVEGRILEDGTIVTDGVVKKWNDPEIEDKLEFKKEKAGKKIEKLVKKYMRKQALLAIQINETLVQEEQDKLGELILEL